MTPGRASKPRCAPPRIAATPRSRRELPNVHYHHGIDADLSRVWRCKDRDDAHQCLPVVLRMRAVSCRPRTEAGRLLRLLLLWHGTVPANTGARQGQLLQRLIVSTRDASAASAARGHHRQGARARHECALRRTPSAGSAAARCRRVVPRLLATITREGCCHGRANHPPPFSARRLSVARLQLPAGRLVVVRARPLSSLVFSRRRPVACRE